MTSRFHEPVTSPSAGKTLRSAHSTACRAKKVRESGERVPSAMFASCPWKVPTGSVPSQTLTFQLHSNTQTFLKPTVRATLSLGFVNLAVLVFYTRVPFIILDCSLKKTL